MTSEQSTPDWKELRKRLDIITSPTQHETFDLCNRKWWLGNVRKLKTPAIRGHVFGSVLHAVAERYLKADDLGRDPATGLPVDLYPEGWHRSYNKYTGELEGELTPDEQDRLRRMVAEAIQAGVLERQPNRRVEREFRKQVLELACRTCGGAGEISPDCEETYECPDCKGSGKGERVTIVGFIDLHTEYEVQDHKTSKRVRYFRSADALRKSTQALVYAKVLLDEAREKGNEPEYITLRHNQYCTDPEMPVVRKTEVRVTPEEIEAEWNRIRKNAAQMVALRRTVEQWHQIPDPPTRERACNAYGGCPFRSICYGEESVEGYEKRMKNQTAALTISAPMPSRYPTKGESMSFFASRLAAAAQNSQQQQQQAPPPPLNPPPQQYTAPAQPLQAVPSAPQPQPESAAVVSPQQAAQHQTTAPPWAKPDCAACGGRGFSSAGYACRICDAKAPEEGRPKSAQFIISVNGNGELTWRPREGTEGPQGSAPAPSAAVPIQSQERVQHSVPEPAPAPAIAPAPAPAIAPAPAPAIAPEPAPASAIAPAPAPAHREEPPQGNKVDIENVPASLKDTHNRKGRPKRSFILCVNCTPISGQEKIGTGRGVHYLHKVLEDISQVLVQEAQKTDPRIQHPSEVDVWQRRDFYARAGAQIAEDFGTDIVVADGIGVGSSDLRTLFDAIRPYAGMEIHTSGMIH